MLQIDLSSMEHAIDIRKLECKFFLKHKVLIFGVLLKKDIINLLLYNKTLKDMLKDWTQPEKNGA